MGIIITETATFRFDSKILSSLKQEATIRDTTLNSIVNKIITEYLDWHSEIKNTNHIHLWKLLPKRLLEKYSDEEIKLIANEVSAAEIKDTVIGLHEKFNIITYLQVLQSWLKASNFVYTHNVDGTKHKFIIQFNMSKKWSLFMSECIKYVCNELDVKCSVNISDKILIFEVNVE